MATYGNPLANRGGINQKTSQVPGALGKPVLARKPISTGLSVLAPKEEVKKLDAVASLLTRPPTLSSLRAENLPQHKRQRCAVAQELIRTAGKENGLFTFRDRPSDVKDIYAEDLGNESLVVAYVEHIYTYLHQREMVRLSANYMDGMSVNPRMRSILMDWIVSVAYKFKMCQDTLFLAVDIVDRFLAIPQLDATKDELQLVGVTAMFIASKFEEVYPPELEDYVFIADNACTKGQIVEAEMMMTNALNFDLSRPSPAHFLRRVSKAADADTEEYCTAKYITELSLLSVDFVAELPSMIAAAALYLTLLMRRGTERPVWDSNLRYYSFYEEAEIKPLASKLLELVKNAPKSRQQCIYKKYCSSKLQEVAVDSASLAGEIAHHFQ